MIHPVDIRVGRRVRQRRWLLGMTQQQLTEKVVLNFNKFKSKKLAPTGSAHRGFGIFQKSWKSR
jgi:hypothetical protein